jgi:UDP-N-acetylmuramyl pentapeptide phosphotransferase/UDP-N-acetylglucosamine-1-phosphate transferase
VSRPARLVAGAVLALAVQRVLAVRPPGGHARWERVNHRGAPVTLLAGPALAVAATATAALPAPAAAVAGLGAAVVGRYDDVMDTREGGHRDKGLRGHARALREGRLRAGAVKVAGIGAASLLAARLAAPERRLAEVVVDGGLVAVCANLVNLLDVRPGRALKAGLLVAAAAGEPGPAGAAAALLPADLQERAMLGDAGANALGALLGLAVVTRARSPRQRRRLLAAGVGLTVASEVVSYSAVIDAVPPLRWVDRLGRRP